MSDDTTPKPCPFCGEPASAAERIDGLQFGCMNYDCEGAMASGWMPIDAWNDRPIEDALRARAEAAEAALSEAKAETADVEQRCHEVLKKLYRRSKKYSDVAECRELGDSAAAWKGAMLEAQKDLLNVSNSIRNLVSPRRRMYEDEREELLREACRARAALAAARAEGVAAERAAVLAFLHGGADAHSGFGRSVVATVLRDHVAYIEAGAHARPVEGA